MEVSERGTAVGPYNPTPNSESLLSLLEEDNEEARNSSLKLAAVAINPLLPLIFPRRFVTCLLNPPPQPGNVNDLLETVVTPL